MIIVALHKWSILVIVTMGKAAPQYPMLYAPMSAMFPQPLPPPPLPPQQPIQIPVPVAVPLSIPIPIPIPMMIKMSTNATKPTTTTPKKPKVNCNFLFPLSMPFPMPMPGPPPVIMIPFPPANIYRLDPSSSSGESSKSSSSSSDDSSDSDSDSDSSSRHKNKPKGKYKHYGIYRRNHHIASDDSADQEVKPVLNYVSRNGDVKLRRHLSKQDAALLIQEELSPQQVHRVHVMVGDDSNDKSRVKVVAESANLPNKSDQKKKKIVLRRSAQQLVNSNKELVFRPPSNKKISNISISFNVAR